jgi:small subunit ribosomal protein S19e
MTTINDADIQKSIENISDKLKPFIKAPDWSRFVKTGPGKVRTPANADWYYMRAASMLITIYKKGPVGVSKLRTKYGNKQRRGHSPAKFALASGKIIRSILQQLDKAELTSYKKDGIHKGRIITAKGQSLVDKNSVMVKEE